MTTHTYHVTGMTCGHCANSVREEISAIPGVADVSVDVTTGAVTVSSATPIELAQVRAAVTEAGYELTG